jgi:two-component system sensor histidine kinase AgrC
MNILLVFILLRVKTEKNRNKTILDYGQHLESVIKELRSFDHEHKGHLQILIRMIEQEESLSELYDYLYAVLHQDRLMSEVFFVKDNTLISAYLHNSTMVAKELAIEFNVNINDMLSSYQIASHDFIDILMNLTNNAFEAVANLPKEKRVVTIDFNDGIIEVKNVVSRDTIKSGIDNFKLQGYSSKGSDRGFGISNILTIAEKYNIEFENYLRGDYYITKLVFEKTVSDMH